MKIITLSGTAFVLAVLFGIVPFASRAAFALPATGTESTNSKPTYHIRTLPGLTGPAHKAKTNAQKKAQKVEKTIARQQAYLGTITKENGHYVLTAGMFTFKLNDQAQVKKFNGKRVQVTGKLNPQTNKIKVEQIKKASA